MTFTGQKVKKFQARQMLQEHLINQVHERLMSKEDTRL